MDKPINFRLGCAVWAFKDWVGNFYPPKSQARNFLKLYGERMSAVEGNSTFYHVPTAATVTKWATATPAGFKFCPKLPRSITHEGPLMPHLSEALRFVELMQDLGDRLGPIMIQLPPRYSPAALSDLTAFLKAWPHSQAAALEVRHLDWFSGQPAHNLRLLLADLRLGRILLDSRPMYDWEHEGDVDPQLQSNRRKPKVPLQMEEATADFVIVRYISHPKLGRNQDYLSEWVKQVKRWLAEEKQIYFFIHCPMEVHSPTIARAFQQLLESADAPVPPLPWLRLTQPPAQLSLF